MGAWILFFLFAHSVWKTEREAREPENNTKCRRAIACVGLALMLMFGFAASWRQLVMAIPHETLTATVGTVFALLSLAAISLGCWGLVETFTQRELGRKGRGHALCAVVVGMGFLAFELRTLV